MGIMETGNLKSLVDCAAGREPADTVILGTRVVNVYTRELLDADVAIKGGRIARVGDVSDITGAKTSVISRSGAVLSPGFIESHIHIESSMLTPTQFCAAVLPRGTTTAVVDPHEIANVLGVKGVRLVIDEVSKLPMRVLVEVPSCVPALEGFETSGATLDVPAIRQLLGEDTHALAEMMNFPGVYLGTHEVLDKIQAAHDAGKIVEGHAPGLSGNLLNAYVSSGIYSDHESEGFDEALEKLRLGVKVQIREGSFAKNLVSIIQGVVAAGIDTRNCLIASDDRHADDLESIGHLDHSLRLAVKEGLDPLEALQMVTINTATHLGLEETLGGIAPGKQADLVILEDVTGFNVRDVLFAGEHVVRSGELIVDLPDFHYPEWALDTVHVPSVPTLADMMYQVDDSTSGTAEVRVMEVQPGSLLTGHGKASLRVEDKHLVPDLDADILPLLVIERHKGTGNIGKGFVRGFGLTDGALASTVAHDSHNIIVVGSAYEHMQRAVKSLIEAGGGLATSSSDQMQVLALQLAGLMTRDPPSVVSDRLGVLRRLAVDAGCVLPHPFMALSFLALPVIPHLKLTDMGLMDVDSFSMTDLIVS